MPATIPPGPSCMQANHACMQLQSITCRNCYVQLHVAMESPTGITCTAMLPMASRHSGITGSSQWYRITCTAMLPMASRHSGITVASQWYRIAAASLRPRSGIASQWHRSGITIASHRSGITVASQSHCITVVSRWHPHSMAPQHSCHCTYWHCTSIRAPHSMKTHHSNT